MHLYVGNFDKRLLLMLAAARQPGSVAGGGTASAARRRQQPPWPLRWCHSRSEGASTAAADNFKVKNWHEKVRCRIHENVAHKLQVTRAGFSFLWRRI